VVHLDARREVVSGDTIMDGGDHETAYADQLLLASCDHILTTKESTLGFVAHASVLKPTFQVRFLFRAGQRFGPAQESTELRNAGSHDVVRWANRLPRRYQHMSKNVLLFRTASLGWCRKMH
jgi:hypothetical protein